MHDKGGELDMSVWNKPELLPRSTEDDGLRSTKPAPISEATRRLAESVGIEVVNREDFMERSVPDEENDREERDEEMIHGDEPGGDDMEVGAIQSQ